MPTARRSKGPEKLALERIDILMERAEKTYSEDGALACRYAAIAKSIAMRHAIPLPGRWKRRICKKCGAFLKPGSNCKVRTHRGALVILCLGCNDRVRIPFTREKRLNRHGKARSKETERTKG